MGAVYFYHLTQRPLEAALPLLLDRSLAQGWRVVVRGATPRRIEMLDRQLWLGAEDGFLPHGVAGGPHDAYQPVLLTLETDVPNRAACLMGIEGAAIAADEVGAFERTCILFDGGDGDALARARDQWRDLTRAGCKAVYWSEETGAWQKKAES